MTDAQTQVAKYTDYDQRLRDLAREVVTNIRDVEDVLKGHGLDDESYARLAATSRFQTMLRQAAAEWDAVSNTKERVRLKSAILVEQAMPDMFQELSNRQEPLSARVSLLNTLAKIGDLGERSAATTERGTQFKLTLNLSDAVAGLGKTESITIESKPIVEDKDDTLELFEAIPHPPQFKVSPKVRLPKLGGNYNDELTADLDEYV